MDVKIAETKFMKIIILDDRESGKLHCPKLLVRKGAHL